LLCKAVESLQGQLMATDRQMFEINLVLEELCANVITHGNGRQIEIGLAKDWDELVITLTDDGAPFDPTSAPEVDIHQPLDGRPVGGLGIHLVHHYTDSFEYRRENDRNIVTLKKCL